MQIGSPQARQPPALPIRAPLTDPPGARDLNRLICPIHRRHTPPPVPLSACRRPLPGAPVSKHFSTPSSTAFFQPHSQSSPAAPASCPHDRHPDPPTAPHHPELPRPPAPAARPRPRFFFTFRHSRWAQLALALDFAVVYHHHLSPLPCPLITPDAHTLASRSTRRFSSRASRSPPPPPGPRHRAEGAIPQVPRPEP